MYNLYVMYDVKFKKIKTSNIIAIGGMIAAGKTTLVNDLANDLKCDVLLELDDNDEIQKSLLKGLYEKQDIAPSVFQLYFFLKRFSNYSKIATNNKLTIVDRTIFEDRLFAHQNMGDDPIVFSFYDNMWKEKINELIYSVGIPKIYIILDIDWDLFVDRLFKRNREVEISNFEKNEMYFRSLNTNYVSFLERTCKAYGINYLILKANLPNDKKIELIKKEIAKIDSI